MNSGIYNIINIISNKKYIGQSTNIPKRLYSHKWRLKKSEHCNPILQNDWNKYGEDSFVFSIIENCSIDNLNSKEAFYISLYQSNNEKYGYNIRIDPCTNRGRTWSEETRKKMEQIMNNPIGWFKNHDVPLETQKKGWATSKGRKKTIEERLNQSRSLLGHKKKNVENMKKAQQGEKNPSAKIGQWEVKQIRYLLDNNNLKIFFKDIGKVFGVKYSNITAIKQKRSWKYINYTLEEIPALITELKEKKLM